MTRSRLLIFTAHALAWSITLPYLCGYAATYDLWAYLTQGKLFWETFDVPRADGDSYLPTIPWVCHNWLASALTYPLFTGGGGTAARALTYIMMVGACVLAYRTARRTDASPFVALLTLLLALPAIAVGALPWRPAMFTLLFVPMLIAWLQCGRLTWLIPLLFVLWANLHAGVAAGLVVLGAHLAASLLRPIANHQSPITITRLGIITFLSAAATLLNPYGLDYWKMIFVTVGGSNTDITEWQPVKLFGPEQLDFQVLVAMTFALLAVAREKGLHRWLTLAVFAAMGFRQVRDVPLFGLAVVALLPPVAERLIARWRERSQPPRLRTLPVVFPVAGLAVAAVVVMFWLRSQPLWLRVPRAPDPGGIYYPVGGVEFLRLNNLRGNVAAFYPWVEYAAWKLHGQCRFSADGRYVTVFPQESLRVSLDFTVGRDGWRKLLDEHPTDLALVPRGTTIESRLRNEARWPLLYADAGCALFAKDASLAGRTWKQPKKPAQGHFP